MADLLPRLRSQQRHPPRPDARGEDWPVTNHAAPTRPPQAPEHRMRRSTWAVEARQLRDGKAGLAPHLAIGSPRRDRSPSALREAGEDCAPLPPSRGIGGCHCFPPPSVRPAHQHEACQRQPVREVFGAHARKTSALRVICPPADDRIASASAASISSQVAGWKGLASNMPGRYRTPENTSRTISRSVLAYGGNFRRRVGKSNAV